MRTFEEFQAAARAFMASRTLLTALELDVFAAVGQGEPAETVAARIGAEPRATALLLNALAALGALVKEDGRYRPAPATAGLDRAGFLHLAHQWRVWSDLTDCVRTGTSRAPDRLAGQAPQLTEAFIDAMDARARQAAPDLVARVGAAGVRRMLDVGGGPGTFALAFARAEPGLQAEILDLEAVLPLARRRVEAAGLADRVALRAGDLRQDAFGEGYDLILLSAICHMLDEAGNQDLLARCARALAAGGRLVVRDFLLDPDRAGPPDAALFALNMLVGTRRGTTYTEAEYRAWLGAAGLARVERLPGEGLLVAWKS